MTLYRTLIVSLTSAVFVAGPMSLSRAAESTEMNTIGAESSSVKTDIEKITKLEDEANSGDIAALRALAELYAGKDPTVIDIPKAIDYFLAAAKGGDAYSLVRLGEIYKDGKLVPSDHEKSFQFFEQAVAKGSLVGRVKLGEIYIRGTGQTADIDKGVALISSSAEAGEKSAWRTLGDIFADTLFAGHDARKAIDFYQKASKAGDTYALVKIGDLHLEDQEPAKAYESFRMASDAGVAIGTLRTASALLSGTGTTKDVLEGIRLLRVLAEKADVEALKMLGDIYAEGKLVERDSSMMVDFYERAATAGSKYTYVKLGDLYNEGVVVEADPKKAADYYEIAAKDGIATGMVRLSEMLFQGKGVEPDSNKALENLVAASKLGDKKALRMLGDVYSSGKYGVTPNGPEAVRFYSEAAAVGDSYSLVLIGEIYRDGVLLPADPSKSVEYFRTSVEKGIPTGKVRLGEAYLKGLGIKKDLETGVTLIAEAGKTGDKNALKVLGDYLSRGDFIAEDISGAVEAYSAAAVAGNPYAYVRLSEIYRDGRIVAKDAKASIAYLQKAIDLGLESAAVDLGENHIYGRYGVYSDKTLGVRLIESAYEKGDKSSVTALAKLYIRGDGLRQDTNKAIKILTEAADTGNAQAAKLLVSIYRDGRPPYVKKNIEKSSDNFLKYATLYTQADMAREKVIQAAASATTVSDFMMVSNMLSEAPAAIQLDTLTSIKMSNPNVFVFIAQDRLKQRGLYKGALNGMLTGATITAINTLCKTNVAAKRCETGPLSNAATRVIALSLSSVVNY